MPRKTNAFLIAENEALRNALVQAGHELVAEKTARAELETAYGWMEHDYKARIAELEAPKYVVQPAPAPKLPPSHDRKAWALLYAMYSKTTGNDPTPSRVTDWVLAGQPGL